MIVKNTDTEIETNMRFYQCLFTNCCFVNINYKVQIKITRKIINSDIYITLTVLIKVFNILTNQFV